MEESDPEFEAEYQAELKRIKLQKAREKARRDAGYEDLDADYEDIGYQAERGRLLMQGDFQRSAAEHVRKNGCSVMLWGFAMFAFGLICWCLALVPDPDADSVMDWVDIASAWVKSLGNFVAIPMGIGALGFFGFIGGFFEWANSFNTVDVDVD